MTNATLIIFFFIIIIISTLLPLISCNFHVNTCRAYCGNITVDYPFSLQSGCGHPGYKDLLFCMNEVLMFHIPSGSYRVLEIDYAYKSLTLHDPHLSTCETMFLRDNRGNGFAVDEQRSQFFNPTADNVFMLIGCSAHSPLFQGFPDKHLACRNVSGMGCEEYYGCPAWTGRNRVGSLYGIGPPECCAVSFESIKAINLTKLDCEGYSSAYSVAPLRHDGPDNWAFGIRVKYSVHGDDVFCRACEGTGGTCGYQDQNEITQICMCQDMNSTSNCDTVPSSSSETWSSSIALSSSFVGFMSIWIVKHIS